MTTLSIEIGVMIAPFLGSDEVFMKQKEVETLTELKQIWQAIQKIEYGSIEIVIHASQIVQIETREKRRFEKKQAI